MPRTGSHFVLVGLAMIAPAPLLRLASPTPIPTRSASPSCHVLRVPLAELSRTFAGGGVDVAGVAGFVDRDTQTVTVLLLAPGGSKPQVVIRAPVSGSERK